MWRDELTEGRLLITCRHRFAVTVWPQDHRAQREAGYHLLQVSELSREIPPEGRRRAQTSPALLGLPWRYWGLPRRYARLTRRNPGLRRHNPAFPGAQTLGRPGGAAQTS